MERIQTIEKPGGAIFVVDFTHIRSDDVFLEILGKLRTSTDARTAPFCTCYDITGTYITTAISEASKALAVRVKSQGLTRGTATVGVTSATKRLLARFIRPDMYFAETVEEGIAYLERKLIE